VPMVDVLFGNEEDFTAALGYEVEGVDESHSNLDPTLFQKMIEKVKNDFPSLSVVATTLRNAKTATRNNWGAIAWTDGRFHQATNRENVEIFDRVGGGDSFASGLIYGLLSGKDISWALECGAVHGALAMTTPGDTSMVTLQEILQVMQSGTARISR
jgi:2-dehydro-3-deoxygluconokinase